jgi:putative DNA primase/helicase
MAGATDPTQNTEKKLFNFTDMGNAERFINQFGDDVLHCTLWDKWIIWEGTRWQNDDTREVERMAKQVARSIRNEVELTPDTSMKADIIKHAKRTESAGRLTAMLRLACSDRRVIVKPEDFDTDPMLLNTSNCLIDLRDGSHRDHDRDDRLMKQAGTFYEPHATCPTWLAFLDQIMGSNENLIRFLQKAVGYALTGSTAEQVVFFLYGKGRNGKSTFLEVLRHLLGDYAKNTPTSTIMRRGESSGVNNDVARLPGVRFVTAVETDENQMLSEATIKSITGGDTIVARFLFGEFFEFKPAFKLFLACNHKPIISGVDNGIWRRIRLIPFSVTIPENEVDPTLPDKLRAELPGILNWALMGCLLWQEEGLGLPDEVRAAVDEYRGEMDVLAGFIADCCFEGKQYVAGATDLYKAYQQWAESNGERILSQKAFGSKLADRGFEKSRSIGGRAAWSGLGLREKVE